MIPVRIIDYHAVKHSMTHQQSQQVFSRLETFLKSAFDKVKSTPELDVDDAWHTFILHTRLYHDYCYENFNRFIHHNPHPVTFINTCDAGGQQRTKCDKEDEDQCEAGFSVTNFAKCDDGGETGRCDAQLQEIIAVADNEHV